MKSNYFGRLALAMAIMALGFAGSIVLAGDGHNHEKGDKAKEKSKPQSTCPIMGGKVNKKTFVDVKGKRIYVCCPGCISAIKKNPEAALKKIADKGEEAETLLKPQTTCPIMGGKINKKLFVDAKGKRIYVCCAGCTTAVKKDPDSALKKLADKGQHAETLLKPQATCPIMGGKINKKLFVDAKGKRIYVCCPGCIAPIKKNPDAALKKLADKGEKAEDAPESKHGKEGDHSGHNHN